MAHVAPRPLDFIAKGPKFWYGFLVGLVALGPGPGRVALSNELFAGGGPAWAAAAPVPLWTIGWLGLLFFIVEELLLQQAKLLWDDVRDHERDRGIPWYGDRGVASGLLSLRGAVFNLILRVLAAFVLAFVLGGPGLVVLFAVILLHQGLYAYWGKPRAAEHPLLLLAILSFSWPLRVLAGVIAIAGNRWPVAPVILVLLIFYFYSFAVMAAQWKMEAEHGRKAGATVLNRLQHGYYLKNGRFWQRYGFLCATVLALALIVVEGAARVCSGSDLVLNWYGSCGGNGVIVRYASPNTGQLVAAGLGAIIMAVFCGMAVQGVVRTVLKGTRQGRRGAGDFVQLIRTPAVVALAVAAVSLVVIALSRDSALTLFWAILCLNVASLVALEGLTYPEYRYEPLRRSLPVIVRAWGAFLLRSRRAMSLGALIALTGSAFDTEWLESAGR